MVMVVQLCENTENHSIVHFAGIWYVNYVSVKNIRLVKENKEIMPFFTHLTSSQSKVHSV